LDQALHGEIKTLGYPGAALLSFCVAILAYNVISVVKTAMAAVHGEAAKREMISGYYLAGELAAAYHGMMIAVPPAEWTRHFASLTPAELASILKTLAAKVRPDRFRKHIRGPKKPRPKRSSAKHHPHVSTARILAQRKLHKTHNNGLKGLAERHLRRESRACRTRAKVPQSAKGNARRSCCPPTP